MSLFRSFSTRLQIQTAKIMWNLVRPRTRLVKHFGNGGSKWECQGICQDHHARHHSSGAEEGRRGTRSGCASARARARKEKIPEHVRRSHSRGGSSLPSSRVEFLAAACDEAGWSANIALLQFAVHRVLQRGKRH